MTGRAVQVYQKEIETAVIESESAGLSKKDVVKEAVTQKQDKKLPEQKILERIHDRDDDDWLLLLDVVSKEESCVPPGILSFQIFAFANKCYLYCRVVTVEV